MKRLSLLLIGAVMSVMAMNAATRVLTVKGSPVELSASAGVNVTVKPSSASPKVTITGPDKALIEKISVKLHHEVLQISVESGANSVIKGHDLKRIKVVYEGALPDRYTASSNAEVTVTGSIAANNRDVMATATSNGDVKFSGISARSFIVSASSNGDVKAGKVSAKTVSITASSNADVELKSVSAMEVAVVSSSNGDVELDNVDVKTLSVNASSNGDVEVSGKAGTAVLSATSTATIDASRLSCTDISKTANSGARIK